MTEKVCQTCGVTFQKPWNVHGQAWARRQFCSITCRGRGISRHGEAWKTREYAIWQAMVQRCTNPTSVNFHKYGARGITVCDAWRDYSTFLADMGRRPSNEHSLERIDNERGYEPGNCRWATVKEQANNTRWNRRLTLNGETLTVAQWAERTGMKSNTIIYRLRRGWSDEKALTGPLQAWNRNGRAG
jgi:hypothetical protein